MQNNVFGAAPFIDLLVGADAVLVDVMLMRARLLFLYVGMCAVLGYTIACWWCRVHRSRDRGGAVDSITLQWERRIVKSDVGRCAVDGKTVFQWLSVTKRFLDENALKEVWVVGSRRIALANGENVGDGDIGEVAVLPRVGGYASVG